MTVVRPAEQNIDQLQKLAILELDGEKSSGKIARASLVQAFFDNKHYELIDQAQLARVQPIATSDGRMSLPAAIEAAGVLGADAVLLGQVISYSVVDDKHKDPNAVSGDKLRERGFSSGAFGVGTDSTESITREATVTLAVQLVDVRTGLVRVSYKATRNSKSKITISQGDSTSRDRLLERLMGECCQEIVGKLAPHSVVIEESLARPNYSRGYSSVIKGNKLAIAGDWSAAQAAWQHAITSNPDNDAAMHNLALAAEVQQDYPGAMHWIDNAVAKSSSSTYAATRSRILNRQRDFTTAIAQGRARHSAKQVTTPFVLQSRPSPSAGPSSTSNVLQAVRLPEPDEDSSVQVSPVSGSAPEPSHSPPLATPPELPLHDSGPAVTTSIGNPATIYR